MVIAQFGELKFEITSSSALLFQGLKISAECETEDQTDSNQQYVAAKNGKPVQVTLTAILDAALGIDVEKHVTYMLNAAQRSLQGYLYVAGKKAFPFQMMLVKAETEEIMISPAGKWVKTRVNATFKQSTKDWITVSASKPASENPRGGGGSSTPAKKSVNTSSWVTNISFSVIGTKAATKDETKTMSTAAEILAQSASKEKAASAVSDASAVISKAKTAATTVAKATSTVSSKITGFLSKIASAGKK